MTIANTSVPVTVLPSPHHGGLGITRSLGRLGIPVFNIDASPWCPSFFSRYCAGRFLHDLDTATAEHSVEWLLDLGRRLGARSILVPTTDAAALLAAANAAALREWFILPDQSSGLVHSLSSKKEMYGLARRHRVPVPVTVFPQTRAELLAAPDRVGLPLIVKGIQGYVWNRESRTKALVHTMARFLELCKTVPDAAVPGLLVQEYIPGSEDKAWMFNGYFDATSECRAAFTGRKIRQCPVYTGAASLAICENNGAVETSAKSFMKAVEYRGIVDIDFRYDSRDGKYKILDVNSRIGSTFRLFVSPTGMDVARALYLDLTGQDVPVSALAAGRKWMVEDLDLVAALGYWREGALNLREWLKSLRGVEEFGFFAFDDPLPLLLMLRADGRELLRLTRAPAERVPPFELKPTLKEENGVAPAEKHACL